MINFFQLFADIVMPFMAGVLVLCIADWIVVMFRRVFSSNV